MSTIDRIKILADHEDIKITALEKQIGASKGVLSRAFNNKTDIQSKWLTKIIENYPHFDSLWLLTGKGSMLVRENLSMNTDEVVVANNVFKLKTDHSIRKQSVPLYNVEAAAGLVELFQSHGDTQPVGTLNIPNLPKCDGAVFVTGDSMYPLLKSGDIVAYKQIYDFYSEIFWGEMYLISVEVAEEEFISVKYIQKSERGEGYIKLVSQNKHHQPKDIKMSKIRAMALVKASVRMNSMG
ncbi:S24 family peptidase [Tenacibaculum jejuense]|uniref:Peptidase S24/S26A/S26B, conserved region n=1 Tax=Tenacibaculum jejuense TaxID=584609 RepID=A0A238UBI5_9FLAO|nr:S24 family peptidase [Tenacibaculum jejuense]SNR16521.1 Peptidase S24/S26A/S26B, conserved region [Tenacibaculum jejuense]